ncbi:hypothetical protein [Eggerthia catenaformis]|nr:hypothetical protein [Eggerthia catenaformis]
MINGGSFGANVIITGSQKVLACPSDVSIIVLDKEAIARVNHQLKLCILI